MEMTFHIFVSDLARLGELAERVDEVDGNEVESFCLSACMTEILWFASFVIT